MDPCLKENMRKKLFLGSKIKRYVVKKFLRYTAHEHDYNFTILASLNEYDVLSFQLLDCSSIKEAEMSVLVMCGIKAGQAMKAKGVCEKVLSCKQSDVKSSPGSNQVCFFMYCISYFLHS